MSQDIVAFLKQSPLTNSQRADLWDAYEAAGDEDALAESIKGMAVPGIVKAKLWDFKLGGIEEPAAEPVAPAIPRHVQPGMGARDLGLEFGQEEVDAAESTGATALGTYGGAALGGPAAAGAGLRVAGSALRFAADPRVGAAFAGGKTLMDTGDIAQAGWAAGGTYAFQKGAGKVVGAVAGKVEEWMSKALRARMAHQVARAAMAEAPAAATAATKVAQSAKSTPAERRAAKQALYVARGAKAAPTADAAAVDIEALLKTARSAESTPAARHAARQALTKAGWKLGDAPAAEAAPAAPAVRKLAPIPEKGNVKMATVYSRPAGAPPTKSKAVTTLAESGRRNLKEEQLEAAKAAGMDVAETFGTAPVARQAEQVAESALETRLRASVLMKKDPRALADEIADRVAQLGRVKPERATEIVQELYGIPAANAKQMVEMVFRAQGWK